jgi:hypothetical protein
VKEGALKMSKAKPLTRIHNRAELRDSLAPRSASTKDRYNRENSPKVIHGNAGMKSDNVRGRYSEPDRQELEDIANDKVLRARTFGRRNKLTATVRALKKA